MSFPQSVAIIKKHEMIVASYVIIAFCSFASLVGGTCGPSPENPNVVHFVDSKNSDRDVKAHLRFRGFAEPFSVFATTALISS